MLSHVLLNKANWWAFIAFSLQNFLLNSLTNCITSFIALLSVSLSWFLSLFFSHPLYCLIRFTCALLYFFRVCLTSVCFHTSTTYLSFSRQSYIWEHCSVEWKGMLIHKKMFFAWFCSSIAYAYLFLLCVSDISTFLHPAPSSAQIWSGMINHCISPHSCIVNPLRFFTATPSDLGNW